MPKIPGEPVGRAKRLQQIADAYTSILIDVERDQKLIQTITDALEQKKAGILVSVDTLREISERHLAAQVIGWALGTPMPECLMPDVATRVAPLLEEYEAKGRRLRKAVAEGN